MTVQSVIPKSVTEETSLSSGGPGRKWRSRSSDVWWPAAQKTTTTTSAAQLKAKFGLAREQRADEARETSKFGGRTVPRVDEKRGFVPSEVKRNKNQTDFLTHLSRRIFSNPANGGGGGGKKQQRSSSASGRSSSSFGRQDRDEPRRSNLFQRAGGGGRILRSRFGESHQFSYSNNATTNPMLEKAFKPAAASDDFDSNSLKRRNPRQMFTDSAFYSPKHHPSVAEQVEMAHRLSSSLYDDGNKMSKGQEMYMKRVKKSGEESETEDFVSQHHKVPNLKLVMNPGGKLHDWTDLAEEDASAVGGSAEATASHDAMVEHLQACKGRGKKKRVAVAAPPTSDPPPQRRQPFPTDFQSSFKRVFDDRRGIFEMPLIRLAMKERRHDGDDDEPRCNAESPLRRSRTVPNVKDVEDGRNGFSAAATNVVVVVKENSSGKTTLSVDGCGHRNAICRKGETVEKFHHHHQQQQQQRQNAHWRPLRDFF